MKKKLKGKLLSLLLAAVLCIGLFPISAGAQEADSLVYLALGDSITSGYRLDDASTECFVPQFAEAIGATTTVNQGVTGLTAATLAAALSTGTYDMALASADVITLTIGGNDLLAAFYQVLAEAYNATYATYISMGLMSAMDADTVKTYLSDPTTYSDEVNAIITLLNDESVISYLTTSTTMSEAVTACIANITAIVTYIKSVNSDAIILVANQYNPYQWLPTTAIGNVSLESVITYFGTVASTYNSYLALAAAGSGAYTVVDVASAFAASEDSLTNAAVTVGFDMATLSATCSFDFDIHPNVDGHKVIADTMTAAYEALFCTLSFETGDGSEIEDVTVLIGTTIDLSEYVPTRDGYNFTGWYTEDTLTIRVESAILSEDVTLYAGWEEVLNDTEEDTETEDTGDSGTENSETENTGDTDSSEESGTEASGENSEGSSDTGDNTNVEGTEDETDTDADAAGDDVDADGTEDDAATVDSRISDTDDDADGSATTSNTSDKQTGDVSDSLLTQTWILLVGALGMHLIRRRISQKAK